MIWIVFAAMIALTVGVLLRPLLRSQTIGAASRMEYDLTVYRDQLEEIARDVERGVLSADQAEAARTEIQRRMLAAADSKETATPVSRASGIRIAAIIAVALPLLALFAYLSLGAPDLPDRPFSGRAAQIAEMKKQAATIQTMVARLAERLQADPQDGKGWAMLARSYRALGQIDEAKAAYVKAIKLLPGEAQPRVEYAVLLLDDAQGDTLPPEIAVLMGEVLASDPKQPDALYFLGLDAAQKGDMTTARAMWSRLLETLPPGTPAHGQVKAQLDSLK